MGCCPIRVKKEESTKAFNSSISSDKHSKHKMLQSTIKSDNIELKKKQQTILSEIKFTNSILVKEGLGDPYLIYEEMQLLGEGTFGQVFKVKHKVSKEIRAMKIINKVSNTDIEEEKAMINEINILKNLDHPNIIKVYEFFNTTNKFFIVTELCTGGELFDKITEVKYFNESVACHIFKQLLSTVRFCHCRNVIHRDLKPENILIESKEERNKEYFNIKVIDFGTSQIFQKNKLLKKQIGTPFYIAPEVLDNCYNEKCDVWSSGVILYILLCGNPPFYGESDEEIYAAVKEAKIDFSSYEWRNVSDDAKDLIRCLLRKDMKGRYSAEEALNHRWFSKMKDVIAKRNTVKSTDFLVKTVNNLKSFQVDQKLQQAALAFIVRHHAKKEDINELRKIFQQFDENNDGHLTKDELYKGLSMILTKSEALKQVEKIMEQIDTDQNGFIEYEEFLRASLNKEKILTKENLKSAFEIFDIDKSGSINARELKKILDEGGNVSDEAWQMIIKDIDKDNDGEISYEEFKKMMFNIINMSKNKNEM